MQHLTLGHLDVSLALVGLAPALPAGGEALRAAVEVARGAECRAITLSAGHAGLRPRELDRSARREIAALLRRNGLGLGGVDALLPAAHFERGEHQERAVDAAVAAIALAGELAALLPGAGAGVVSVVLPDAPAADVVATLAGEAERWGVRVADLAWRAKPLEREASGRIGVGIDPAAVFMGGGDPVMEAARAGAGLVSARLSDVSAGGRTAAGSGRLDLLAYRAALAAAGYAGLVVLDVRQCPEPMAALRRGAERWRGSGPW
jgi:sugar phosphate isomerase/epimerase